MTTDITHRLVGYDPATGRVAAEFAIPATQFPFAKRVAAVGSDDTEAVLCYRLSPSQARELATTIGAQIDPAGGGVQIINPAPPARVEQRT